MINGWFPHINGRGEIVSGAGEIFLGDRAFGPGHAPAFVTDDLIVCSRPTSATTDETILRDTRTGRVVASLPYGFNEYAAGGGRWLGFRATAPTSVRLCVGAAIVREWFEACAPVVAPGGRYAFAKPYQSETRTVYLGEGDADPVPIFTGVVMHVSLSDQAIALLIATGRYTRQVLGYRRGGGQWENWSVREWEDPRVCDGPDGEPWVLSVTQTGLILRPARAREGYTWAGEWFNPAIRYIDGVFVIAASDGAGRRKTATVDPATARVPLVAPPSTPPPPDPKDPATEPEPTPMAYTPHAPDITHLIRARVAASPVEWEEARKAPGKDRTDRFVRLLAADAHAFDARFGLNGKRGGDEISADALAFTNPTVPASCGGVEIRDFISSAHDVVWQDVTILPGHPDHPDGVAGKWIQPSLAAPTPADPTPPTDDTPAPPPGDPGLPGVIASILNRLSALEGPRTVAIKSSRDRYLRDEWADNTARFDRDAVGRGEVFTLDPLDPKGGGER